MVQIKSSETPIYHFMFGVNDFLRYSATCKLFSLGFSICKFCTMYQCPWLRNERIFYTVVSVNMRNCSVYILSNT